MGCVPAADKTVHRRMLAVSPVGFGFLNVAATQTTQGTKNKFSKIVYHKFFKTSRMAQHVTK
jgi:hypothetical protein